MRVEVELAKLGITIDDLVCDGWDDPRLKPILERLESEPARRRAALEWFGDQGHPQPEQRKRRFLVYHAPDLVTYAHPTPDWGRLPPLEDGRDSSIARPPEEPPEPRQRGAGRIGKEYRGADVEAVVRAAREAVERDEHLGRTLRNRIAAGNKVTPYMVDLVFALMSDEKLDDAGRKGWLTINGQLSATPAYINLHDLISRS